MVTASSEFPIAIPERLPVRITPCPIVEAIFEVRFASSQPWENMPGMLYAEIRGKFPKQTNLPLLQLPEDLRRQDPALQHLPLLQFHGERFLIQIGPRCLSLVTQANAYPGWAVIQEELKWVIARVAKAGFVSETERIGVRYIDFFHQNVFENLQLHLQLGGTSAFSPQTDVTTVLKKGSMTLRLHASNAALSGAGEALKTGSVLDVDAWFGALDADLFGNGLDRFSEAHHVIKGLFFGLMKSDFLASLNPEYQ